MQDQLDNIGSSQRLAASTMNSALFPTTAIDNQLNFPDKCATVAAVDVVLSSHSNLVFREFGQPAEDSSGKICDTLPSSVNSSDNECVSIG